MDLRQLKYFKSVYEQGSISSAARHCAISQPSISTAIQQLEDELGVRLFIRQPKGVLATEHGVALYEHSLQLLGQLESIKNSFLPRLRKHSFRLGLVRALGVERMSALLRNFGEAVVGLELHLVEPDEECDARLISAKEANANEIFTPIWCDNYLLALPLSHPLAMANSIQLADLDHQPFIKRTPCDAWENLHVTLIRLGVNVDIRADIHTVEYALGLVSAGVGCALIPEFQSLTPYPGVVLKPIADLPLPRTIGLAYAQIRAAESSITLLHTLCMQASNLSSRQGN